jgi:hypothetical protein
MAKQSTKPVVIETPWYDDADMRLMRVNDARENYKIKFGVLSTLRADDVVGILKSDTTADDAIIALAMRELEGKITKVLPSASMYNKDENITPENDVAFEWEEPSFDATSMPVPNYSELQPTAKRLGEAFAEDAEFRRILGEQQKIEVATKRNPVMLYRAMARIAQAKGEDLNATPIPGSYADAGEAPQRLLNPKLSNQAEFYKQKRDDTVARGSWFVDQYLSTHEGRDCRNKILVLQEAIKPDPDTDKLSSDQMDLYRFYTSKDYPKPFRQTALNREKAYYRAGLGILRLAGGLIHQLYAVNNLLHVEAYIRTVRDDKGVEHVQKTTTPISIWNPKSTREEAGSVYHYTVRAFLRLDAEAAKAHGGTVEELRNTAKKGKKKTAKADTGGIKIDGVQTFINFMQAGESYMLEDIHRAQLNKLWVKAPNDWLTSAMAIISFEASLRDLVETNDLVRKVEDAQKKLRDQVA